MTELLGKLVLHLHFMLTNAKSFKTFMMLFWGVRCIRFFCSRFCCVPIWPVFDEIIFAPNSQSILSANWKGHSTCFCWVCSWYWWSVVPLKLFLCSGEIVVGISWKYGCVLFICWKNRLVPKIAISNAIQRLIKCLAFKRFDTTDAAYGWETCQVVRWYNGSFVKNFFKERNKTTVILVFWQ